MHIYLNGNLTEVADGIPMAGLIKTLGLGEKRLAVEVNTELVPRGRFEQHQLRPGDRVEIIQAVGGG